MEHTASSPGKLILSGEHAVVRGSPALAMAVTLEARVKASSLETDVIRITLPDRPEKSFPLSIVREQLKQDQKSQQAGNLFHKTPLEPEDLLARCAGLTSLKPLDLIFESTLPVGAGLGSSAAFILALIKSIRPGITDAELERLAVQGEKYQHGKTSGLDVAVSLRGGLLHFQQGVSTRVELTHPVCFSVYQSGKPESSTGDCVAKSQQIFESTPGLEGDFRSITDSIMTSVQNHQADQWHDGLRANHHLLCKLGVVPRPVQEAIGHLESSGFSAKVCGAGSVTGQGAGMILVTGKGPHPVPDSWTALSLTPSPSGTRLL